MSHFILPSPKAIPDKAFMMMTTIDHSKMVGSFAFTSSIFKSLKLLNLGFGPQLVLGQERAPRLHLVAASACSCGADILMTESTEPMEPL